MSTRWVDDAPAEGLHLFSDDPAYRPGWRAPRRRSARPAAGILPRYTDADGTVWYLLGLRTLALGGTWSNIGGSIERGENALVGAAREFTEELDLPLTALGNARVRAEIQSGTPEVPYTLFVVDVDRALDDASPNWEHDDVAWWREDAIDSLNLHHGFARAWAQVEVAR